MINQFKVEIYKFVRSAFFWFTLLFIIFVAVYGGIKWDITAHADCLMMPFKDALPDVSFSFMFSLFTAWFIGNSFGTRTIQHEITAGASRFWVIMSRLLPVVLSGVILHLIYIAVQVITLGARIGFDTLNITSSDWKWLGVVMLQLVALECFFAFIDFACCNLYTGLIASVIASITMCNIFRNVLRDVKWYQLSFFHFAENTDSAVLGTSAVVALISIAALIVLSYVVFRRREI